MAGNPWDNDPIVSAAKPAAGNPWDNDAIVSAAKAAPPSPEEEQFNEQNEAEIGAGEAAGSLISGAAGQAAGGLGMMGQGLINTGRTVGHAVAPGLVNAPTVDPLDVARGISGSMTYQPRTEQGQAATGALGEAMMAPDRPIEAAEDILDPSGNLKATARDVAERANYLQAGAAVAAPFLRTSVPRVPMETPPAPPKLAPGPVTAEDLRAGPQRLPAPAPVTETRAAVPVPGKPHIRPKAAPEPAPTAAAAAEHIRAQEGGDIYGGPTGSPAALSQPGQPETPVPLSAPARDEAEISAPAPGADEQAGRVSAIHQLQQDTGAVLPTVRKSAVTGDYRETGTDYQLAELGDPTMRAQIDQENNALGAGSQAMVDRAGGTARGVGQAALEQRGTVIDRALQGIGDWFDRNIRQSYKDANAAAGGVPMTKFDNLQGLLSDHSQFTGVEGRQLHNDIAQVAQQFGMMGSDGFWKPTTVATAERFREWLGEQYLPRTGRAIRRVKDALDSDVASHGGQGLYEKARALRTQRDQMLEGPKGIAKLMPEKLPDGRLINRPVPLDRVADHVANMPREQFDHIINVLHDSAKLGNGELAKGNAAAINELRRHMAERLHEAGTGGRDGMWNPYDYHDQLDAYSTKMPAIFSPEGMRRFNTIHDAGNALRLNKRYPGAAKQIMQAGGLRALAAPRVAGMVESAALGWLGPAKSVLAEATGIAPAMRRGIERAVGGNTAERQAAQVGERLQPLGQRMRSQGGFIGTPEQRASIIHEDQGRGVGQIYHRYRVPGVNSHLDVVERPGMQTRFATLAGIDDKAERGKGWGTSMLARAVQDAHDAGQTFKSDSQVSLSQAGAYANLRKLGYDVVQKPSVSRQGEVQSHGDHVFEVRPRKPSEQPLGQRLAGGKQRGGPKFSPKNETPLAGAPEGDRPNGTARAAGAAYMKSAGLPHQPLTDYRYVQPEVAKAVADAYDKMPHAPNDPKVKAAYDTFKAETLAQYKQMVKAGVNVSLDKDYPYKVPREVQADVRNNNHMSIFPTEQGFGEGAAKPDPSKPVYMRIGDWDEKNPRSTDYTRGRPEAGLSVYDIDKHGNPHTGNEGAEWADEDLQSRLQSGAPRHYVQGDLVGQGASGEPLLANVRKVSRTADHPMLERAPIKMGGKDATYNDLFRATHDYYGHVAEGNGFRANGEYNAWRAHRTMYSDAAKPAMDSETLGQNSWVNNQPKNIGASQTATTYADQKAGLLPPRVVKAAEGGVSANERHVTNQLTDQERAQLNSATTQRLVNMFHSLPDTAETAAAALAGKAKKGWYRASAEAISNQFGPDAPRFAATLAAMSPQTSVQMNFHNALRTFVNWDKAGRPTDPATIKQIMADSVQKQPGGKGSLPAWENNTVRALTAEDPTKVALSGPKVHSFYNNLIGNVHEVTNDAWMAAFNKIDPTAKGTNLTGTLNQSGPGKSTTYLAMSAKVREAAKMLTHMTGEPWTPAEVQETVWSWAKTAFEHAEELGETTIPELVKHGKLTDELIRSTPDFHQLFSSPEHRGFLADSRYAANAERVAGTKGAGAKSAAPSKASAAAEETLRPHLLAAAERLEQLRQERNNAGLEKVPF